MKFYYKMEKLLGKYAVPNLMRYIAGLYMIGTVIAFLMPEIYWNFLWLDPAAILRGQIWRVVTFMVWPPSSNLILNLLVIYCYYNLGSSLEQIWGTFRFNFYFFAGVLGHIVAAFLLYFLLGVSIPLTTNYLNMSVMLAYCVYFPESRFYLYYVIPIKAKWIAFFLGATLAYGLIFGGIISQISIACSMINFLVFFAMTRGMATKNVIRRKNFERKMNEGVRQEKKNGRHRCVVCGRTDLDDPALVFRFCSKCEDDFEYCQDHLYTHQHVIRGGMDPRQAGSNITNFNRN